MKALLSIFLVFSQAIVCCQHNKEQNSQQKFEEVAKTLSPQLKKSHPALDRAKWQDPQKTKPRDPSFDTKWVNGK